MSQLTFFAEEPPARTSPSPASELDWMERVAASCSPMARLLADIGPAGWSGRTCPASFRTIEDEHLRAFWASSPDGGSKSLPADGSLRELSRGSRAHTASHGECLTLSTCEHAASHSLFRNDAAVCGLSDILETGDVPPRYFLTAKACQGILRRAGARGKSLPPSLLAALEAVASGRISISTAG